MTRIYAVEPWRFAVVVAGAVLAYSVVPIGVTRGSNGAWLALVSALAAIDELVGHCSRKAMFSSAGWLCWILGAGTLVLGVLVRGVDPRLTALFAVATALLQLLVFRRAAHSLLLLADSKAKLGAGSCWAVMSLLIPSAAILSEGTSQTVLVLAWSSTAGLAAALILHRFKVVHPPVPRAASF